MKKHTLLIVIGAGALTLVTTNMAFAATPFQSVFGGSCSTYECWIEKVWTWSMAVIIPLSVLILSAAGILYMTSEGDSGRIGIAKKMIIGVLSGVALIVLARFLLVGVIGISDDQYDGVPGTPSTGAPNIGTPPSDPGGGGGGISPGGGDGGGGGGGGAD